MNPAPHAWQVRLTRTVDRLASAIDRGYIEIGDGLARLLRRLAALLETPPPRRHAHG